MILETNPTGAIGFVMFCFISFYAFVSYLWQNDPLEQIGYLIKQTKRKIINHLKNKQNDQH